MTPLARLLVRAYFRRVEVEGPVPSPGVRGRLVAANHVNALVDPLLVVAASRAALSPLAKATLWSVPVLRGLLEAVVDENCALGLATDGDADRIGLVDEEGQFVDSHKILALLVKYLHEEKGLRGDIVKTFSTTDMLDRMGEAYGLPVRTTPIGFKYVGPMIIESDVLVGGEESGGMAVKGHIPERDGLYIGLTVAEMMVKRERTLSGLVRELMEEFGPHYQSRDDLHTTEDRKQAVLRKLREEGLAEIDGKPVTATEDLDGFKFRTDGGWLMFRPSGTEPVLRIYSEAESQEAADALVRWGVGLVNNG